MSEKVYRLVDLRNKSIRYVGVTRGSLAIRLSQHLACDGSNPNRDDWIKEAGPDNVGIEEIEAATNRKEALKREAYWIHRYLDEQVSLTNLVIPAHGGKSFERATSVRPSTPTGGRNPSKYIYVEVALPRRHPATQRLLAKSKETATPLTILIRQAVIKEYGG